MAEKNQGEGNREAAEQYNEKTREFVKSGRVEQSAQDAKRAVEGKEKAELDRAEQAGKSHAKGEDPALTR